MQLESTAKYGTPMRAGKSTGMLADPGACRQAGIGSRGREGKETKARVN